MRLNPYVQELIETAKLLAFPGKGILAADESIPTLATRFSKINLSNTAENREAYRSMLFTTPNLSKFISGVIQFEETLTNKLSNGESLQSVLKKNKLIPGIKVDKGLALLPTNESVTVGLDGLSDRCKEFYSQGCRFAKWRAVIKIGKNSPSNLAILENANSLARYASICQYSGLVPIVEPEVLAEGDHSIEECAEVSTKVYTAVINSLHLHGVILEGILLKPNMITSGVSAEKASSTEIALQTLKVLNRTIPSAVPGIMFLSGGQSEEEASFNLNAINSVPGAKKPWTLSFSFGRALQASCIKDWGGINVKEAQATLIKRAEANSQASLGKYQNTGVKGESLHVSNYSY